MVNIMTQNMESVECHSFFTEMSFVQVDDSDWIYIIESCACDEEGTGFMEGQCEDLHNVLVREAA